MTTSNEVTPGQVTERSLAERSLRSALQRAELDLAEARVAHIDWSTMRALARSKIQMDIFTAAVGMLDRGKDVASVIRDLIEQLSESLLNNHHKPSSTCPFSNAMEIEWNDVAVYQRRFWLGILRGIEREDARA